MRHEPGSADLLRAARDALVEEVLPGLQGGQRYAALMIANALGMVERELASGDRRRASDLAVEELAGRGDWNEHGAVGGLCRAIREGHHDGDQRVHAVLYLSAIAAVAVTRPDMLTEWELKLAREETALREVLNGSEVEPRNGLGVLQLC